MTAQAAQSSTLLLTGPEASPLPQSRLIAWSPHTSSVDAPPRRPHAIEQKETWLITVTGSNAAELWLSGDFNNWRIPGLRMKQTHPGTFETTLELPPSSYQFACYEFQPSHGFHRIPSDKIQCFLISQFHG